MRAVTIPQCFCWSVKVCPLLLTHYIQHDVLGEYDVWSLNDYRYIFVLCITVVTVILPQCSFIDFSTLDGATSAVKLRDVYLQGKKLTIRFAYSTTTNSGNGSSSEWSVEMHVCV